MMKVKDTPFLKVSSLKKSYLRKSSVFSSSEGGVKALDGVSFSLSNSRTLGLVGESGSGKSTLGRAVLRLIEPDSGKVFFNGVDITSLSKSDMRGMRRSMQIIFQDPYSSLDPRMTIEQSISEPLFLFKVSASQRKKRVASLIDMVGLTQDSLKRYPHEFSGGQRQRVVIARALALEPVFIVADEPVSALDVSIQAQILNLLRELQQSLSLSMLFISHDFSVVRYLCSDIAVMYRGNIVEQAPAEIICTSPLHPYTKVLIASLPDVTLSTSSLPPLKNSLRPKSDVGCPFYSHCQEPLEICSQTKPLPSSPFPDHILSCHKF